MLKFLNRRVQKLLLTIKGKPVVIMIGPPNSGKITFGTALFNYFKSGGRKLGVDKNGKIKEGYEVFE